MYIAMWKNCVINEFFEFAANYDVTLYFMCREEFHFELLHFLTTVSLKRWGRADKRLFIMFIAEADTYTY